MKIQGILKFLFIFCLFFSSFCSFSQIIPLVPIKNPKHFPKNKFHKTNVAPTNKPVMQMSDSSKVCDGYIMWTDFRKCSVLDRKGNALFNFPGNLAVFFINKEKMASHSSGDLIVYNKNLDVIWRFNVIVRYS